MPINGVVKTWPTNIQSHTKQEDTVKEMKTEDPLTSGTNSMEGRTVQCTTKISLLHRAVVPSRWILHLLCNILLPWCSLLLHTVLSPYYNTPLVTRNILYQSLCQIYLVFLCIYLNINNTKHLMWFNNSISYVVIPQLHHDIYITRSFQQSTATVCITPRD